MGALNKKSTREFAPYFCSGWCCQTNEPKHQYLVDGYFYENTKERHSVRAASRLDDFLDDIDAKNLAEIENTGEAARLTFEILRSLLD